MRFTLSIILLSLFVLSAQAGTYYASSSAGGTGDGSFGDPWTLTQATSTAAAGDTVYFFNGTYSGVFNPSNTGTSGNYIVFRNYPGAIVTIQNTTNATCLDLSGGEDYIELDSLIFETTAGASRTYNSYLDSCDYLIIKNCKFYGPSGGGEGAGGSYDGRDVYVANFWRDVTYGFFKNLYFDAQDVSDSTDTSLGQTGDTFGLQGVWDPENSFGSRYNVFEDITGVGGGHSGFTWGKGGVVQDNMFRNITWTGAHHNFEVQTANANNWLQDLRSYKPGRNWRSGDGESLQMVASTGQRVRYSVLVDDTTNDDKAGGSYRQWHSSTSLGILDQARNHDYNYFYHNTVYGQSLDTWGNSIYEMVNYKTGNYIQNNRYKCNIFAFANDQGSYPLVWMQDDSNYTQLSDFIDEFFGNLLYDPNVTDGDYIVYYANGLLASWTLAEAEASKAAQWADNIDSDPKFVDTTTKAPGIDLTLQSDSPARDAAIALTLASGGGSSSTTLNVDDGNWFYAPVNGGLYGERGDSIKVGSALAEISSISGNTLTLVGAISWSDNDSIWVIATWHSEGYVDRMVGSYPDIGAYEYQQEGATLRRFLKGFRR